MAPTAAATLCLLVWLILRSFMVILANQVEFTVLRWSENNWNEVQYFGEQFVRASFGASLDGQLSDRVSLNEATCRH
jgi:hypothetical protein